MAATPYTSFFYRSTLIFKVYEKDWSYHPQNQIRGRERREADIEWFSYYDVRGIGKARQGRIYRGVVYDTSTIERILISIVVRDKNTEKTVQAIIKAAQTGEIGDGRIFVIPIEDAIRIRTAERGDIALYNAEQER